MHDVQLLRRVASFQSYNHDAKNTGFNLGHLATCYFLAGVIRF